VTPPVIRRCPCCWGRRFTQHPALWADLITEWGLSAVEARRIDRQQAYRCDRCHTTLRGMVLAEAIMRASDSRVRPFAAWVLLGRGRLLEINGAAQLHWFFKWRRSATLVAYPDVDIQRLPYASGSFDLVVHSDTLEHVADPVQGLRECRRVLRKGGALVFTIPIVEGRMTRRRDLDRASYHGSESNSEYLVITEYGADFWLQALQAGFTSLTVVCLDYPSGLAIICQE
jgi:SAM-dependent methyltransferase